MLIANKKRESLKKKKVIYKYKLTQCIRSDYSNMWLRYSKLEYTLMPNKLKTYNNKNNNRLIDYASINSIPRS